MLIDTALVQEVKVDQKTHTVLCTAVSLSRPKTYTDIPVVGDKPVIGANVVVIGGIIALSPTKDTLHTGFFDLPSNAKHLAADCNSAIIVQDDQINLQCGRVGMVLERADGYVGIHSENLAIRTGGIEIFDYEEYEKEDDPLDKRKRVFTIRGAETAEQADKRHYNWTIHVSDGELVIKYCHQEKEWNSYIHLRPTEIEAKVTQEDKVSVIRLTPQEVTLKLSSGQNQVIRLTPGELHLEAPHITVRANKVDFVKGLSEQKEKGERCNRWEQESQG